LDYSSWTGRKAFLDKSPFFQWIQCKVVSPENSQSTRLDIKQDEKRTRQGRWLVLRLSWTSSIMWLYIGLIASYTATCPAEETRPLAVK
jgi:hypothetical protein